MISIPPRIASPLMLDGTMLVELLVDLTAYLPSASVDQLDFLVDWYRRICPSNRFLRYKIAELFAFDSILDPNLGKEGTKAYQRGEPLPFLATVRKRITDGRSFHIRFWDGQPAQAFGFAYWQIKDDQDERHTFVRITLPRDFDCDRIVDAARELLDNIPILSGHGGLVFGYDSNRKFDAFTEIYPLSKRYWGIDVEDLNGTLPLTKSAIKGVNWLTLIGSGLEADPGVVTAAALASQYNLQLERHKHGLLFRAGPVPVVGDRHRPSGDLDPLFALGTALKDLVVKGHPSFSGAGFTTHGNTDGYLHRFDQPSGW